jgi:hypothetical protein
VRQELADDRLRLYRAAFAAGCGNLHFDSECRKPAKDAAMSNVVSFPDLRRQSPPDRDIDMTQAADMVDLAGRTSRLLQLQSKVKRNIRDAILLADIVALQAHAFAESISDPAQQGAFRERLLHIEKLTEMARARVSAL